MIKALLKKQLAEIFKAYFFDMKKNKARTKVSTVLYFILFTVLMIGVMGTMFGVLSFGLSSIISLGFGWLYFSIMGLLAVLLGVFGSVFSTYSGLYLAKDNDLLLSMPIPVRAIMVSRLLGVYLMGLMYSAVAMIPAVIVYFIVSTISFASACGTVFFVVLISFFVLALSCIFGYFVARISLRLKNKSYITVIISLAFFALYYFVYFKANTFLGELIKNVAVYGKAVKENAYWVYVIGRAGEGKLLPLVAISIVVFAVLGITLYVISRSFIKIATSTLNHTKVKYKQKRQVKKTILSALISKEMKRFTASPNYMLNCGLGIAFLIAVGIMIIIKAGDLRNILLTDFFEFEDIFYVAVTALICMITAMNDIAAPSVSLEGKTIWQIRSLPVLPKTVLKSKYLFQILVNILPTAFCAICVIIALRPDVLTSLLILVLTEAFVVFHALFSLYCGLHKVNLNWTNEVVPIKQSIGVLFAIFGGWGYAIGMGVLYLLFGTFMAAKVYMFIFLIITVLLSVLLYRIINKRGVKIFEGL